MEQIKFVILRYPKINILINECQLSAGIKIEKEIGMTPVSVFIHSLITFNNQKIAVLDFIRFLETNFGIIPDREEETALITNLEELHPSTVKLINRAFEKVDEIETPLRYLGIKVNKQLESIYMDIDEIRLLPQLIREHCAAHGVIGTGLPEGKGNSYLIDINSIITESIQTGGINEP